MWLIQFSQRRSAYIIFVGVVFFQIFSIRLRILSRVCVCLPIIHRSLPCSPMTIQQSHTVAHVALMALSQDCLLVLTPSPPTISFIICATYSYLNSTFFVILNLRARAHIPIHLLGRSKAHLRTHGALTSNEVQGSAHTPLPLSTAIGGGHAVHLGCLLVIKSHPGVYTY